MVVCVCLEAPYFIDSPMPLVRTLEGSLARIRCKVRGFPRPLISWSKNGIPIQLNSDLRFVSSHLYQPLAVTWLLPCWRCDGCHLSTVSLSSCTADICPALGSGVMLRNGSPLHTSRTTMPYFNGQHVNGTIYKHGVLVC